MTQVVVIGCGVVGAMIAYELSQIPGLSITVLEQHQPAQASTGAALGILVGIVSQKLKGKAMRLRLESIRRYQTLIPELEAATGQTIVGNRQGLLHLCFADEELTKWQHLVEVRRSQGWRLELLGRSQLQDQFPYIQHPKVIAAVYSPDDRQINPKSLTLALVTAAQQRGVNFQFGVAAQALVPISSAGNGTPNLKLQTSEGDRVADWVVIAAGLGSTPLTHTLAQPIDIRPVLGQALRLRLAKPLGDPAFQPVLSGNDTHIVPLGQGDYWIGATVEFPSAINQRDFTSLQDFADLQPNAAQLEIVRQQAIDLCPALAAGEVLETWSGLRPRPEGQPAPVICKLPGYDRVLIAAGHYRNGVLLAPATATAVKAMLKI